MVMRATSTADLVDLVADVEDPELPHVSIGDLGIVRSVDVDHGTRRVRVVLTPTYTGCPATEQINDDVTNAIERAGYRAEIEMTLSPAWSTDWITDRGRERLKRAGIAPPAPVDSPFTAFTVVEPPVQCPRCNSRHTRRIAQFGSTACKASYVCNHCHEPFDYFKPH